MRASRTLVGAALAASALLLTACSSSSSAQPIGDMDDLTAAVLSATGYSCSSPETKPDRLDGTAQFTFCDDYIAYVGDQIEYKADVWCEQNLPGMVGRNWVVVFRDGTELPAGATDLPGDPRQCAAPDAAAPSAAQDSPTETAPDAEAVPAESAAAPLTLSKLSDPGQVLAAFGDARGSTCDQITYDNANGWQFCDGKYGATTFKGVYVDPATGVDGDLVSAARNVVAADETGGVALIGENWVIVRLDGSAKPLTDKVASKMGGVLVNADQLKALYAGDASTVTQS